MPERARSPRNNGSKTWGRSSAAKPAVVGRPRRCGAGLTHLDLHVGACRTALSSTLVNTRSSATGSPAVPPPVGDEVESTRPLTVSIARPATRRDRPARAIRLTCVLGAREGEQVADQAVQVVGLALSAGERVAVADAVLDRLQRAAQREQRRAQVVGDRGDRKRRSRSAAAVAPSAASSAPAMPPIASPTCATSRARVVTGSTASSPPAIRSASAASLASGRNTQRRSRPTASAAPRPARRRRRRARSPSARRRSRRRPRAWRRPRGRTVCDHVVGSTRPCRRPSATSAASPA